jgi:hypothetical protein
MSKLVSIVGKRPADKDKQDCIDVLKVALKRAEQGMLLGVCIAGVDTTGAIYQNATPNNQYAASLIGAMTLVRHKLMDTLFDAEEIEEDDGA